METPMETVTISYRAECQADVEVIEDELRRQHVAFTRTRFLPDAVIPDVVVEMQCALGVDRVKQLIQDLPDVHVICGTMAELPIEENPMKR